MEAKSVAPQLPLLEYLKDKGLKWVDVPTSARKLLPRVWDAIEKRLDNIKDAEAAIVSNAINHTTISNDLGVTRKTVSYNNKIVSELIDDFSSNKPKQDVSAEKYERLKKEYDDVCSQVREQQETDIRLGNMAIDLDHMKTKLAEKETECRNKQEQIDTLLLEIREFKAKEINAHFESAATEQSAVSKILGGGSGSHMPN